MTDILTNPVDRARATSSPVGGPRLNVAECELLRFIDSVSDLFGPDQSKFLTEIWMDALASMECMPAPTSPDWDLVTLAASVRLAAQLLAVPNRYAAV